MCWFDPADIKERFTGYVLLLIVCLRNMEQFAWNPGNYMFSLKPFFFYIIVKANSLSISKACFENWFYVKGYNISTILQGFSASHDKKNLLNSSFPAVLVLVDPLQHLGDVSLLQTSVNESEQSEGWALGFLCDSPLKTVSSSCQSQSQTHSRWQTRPVS